MKSFEDWKFEELELTFGLQRVKTHPVLTQWLASKHPPNAVEQTMLQLYQSKLADRAEVWNEDEVKFYFIGPLITLVDYIGDTFGPFNQRLMSVKTKDIKGQEILMRGRVEFMVAFGKQDPRRPYFFLQEYKQEKRRENDPLGQVLAAMIAAQAENQIEIPLYGCYVVGRFWFFVVLTGKKYAVSLAYDATQPALLHIFSILKEAKQIIVRQVPTVPTP